MSYAAVLNGLHVRFATVDGLASNRILDYEPTSIQDFPLLYSLFDSFQREERGQVITIRWRILHRLCFRWQDNATAEQELIPFLDSVPDSVSEAPTLGGVAEYSKIPEATGTFVTLGGQNGQIVRCIDFYSETKTRKASLWNP